MEKIIKFDKSGQVMTRKFKNFKVITDFNEMSISAKFDFKAKSFSLFEHGNLLDEFARLDERLTALAARKKPLSDISVGEFMKVVKSME